MPSARGPGLSPEIRYLISSRAAGEDRYKSRSVGRQRKVTPIRLESLNNTPGSSKVYSLQEDLGRSVIYRKQRKFGD